VCVYTQVLIYVFDVESADTEKDMNHFMGVLEVRPSVRVVQSVLTRPPFVCSNPNLLSRTQPPQAPFPVSSVNLSNHHA